MDNAGIHYKNQKCILHVTEGLVCQDGLHMYSLGAMEVGQDCAVLYLIDN